jgi:hypothetical protein
MHRFASERGEGTFELLAWIVGSVALLSIAGYAVV